MDAQAKKHEVKGVQTAAKNIRGQCMNCHDNFRD